MRVLFDQCTPEALRKELPGHDIQTANEAGVSDLENGDLIDEAVRRGYDLLVTADRRMQKQEEIKGKPLRVVVLTRPDWSKVEKQIHEVREAIATAEPGKFTRVIARKTEPQPRLKFEERDDGLFDLTETRGNRHRKRTLQRGVTIRAGLEWLADAKLIPKDDVPQRERDLLEDLKRRRSRGQGR